MIGLRWKKEKDYLLKEKKITTRHNLVDQEETIWASFIETKDGYLISEINFTLSEEKNAKIECEHLAKAKILDKIELLQAILD